MMRVGAITAVVSLASSLLGSSSAAKAKEKAIRAQRVAAKYKYNGIEDSINLMKATSRESSKNAIGEVLRVGAANVRAVQQEVTKAGSTAISRQEGISSGKTRGRQMIGLYIKGNEAKFDTQDQTTSQIVQIATEQDNYTNELNNKLISAHDEMAAVLSNEGSVMSSGTTNAISAGISGVQTGIGIYNAWNSTSTGTTSIGAAAGAST